ncbi:MAG: choice-of-anchor Q domain-containing protein [Deltaproteobacteria bacterium]|nr:choice-of-anchor Q domain-containing protein [Deltaproteobacteria bacterium]
MQAKRPGGRTTVAVAAAALLALQAVAADAVITNVTTSSTIEFDNCLGGNTTKSEAIVSTAPNTFTVRYGFNIYCSALGTGEHPQGSSTAGYAANFAVISSGNYDMTITAYRAGELRREHLDIVPVEVSCGVKLSEMPAPSVTLNAVEPGPALDDITFPGATIEVGSDDLALELAEGSRSQTISLRNRPTNDSVALAFSTAGATLVNTLGCEVSARLGSQAVGSDSFFCPTCGYPGTGNRDIDQDGLFVTVTVQDLCGNGDPNPGEECDTGELNGTLGSCCTATCQLRAQNEVCRPAAGDCDQDDVCTGVSPECPADAKQPTSQVCRPEAADGCDIAEFCSGIDNGCPADLRRGDGALCRPANPDALGCDIAEVCDGGVCQPDAKAQPGSQCQADANPCTNERCNDSGQCAHVPVAPAGKFCDDAQFCNGEDRCDAAGACAVHLNAPCGGTQTCDEVGDACLAQPAILVTNADDSGAGSLRAALGQANLHAGPDSIGFDPEFFRSPRRITLTGALPDINGDLAINGPGANLLAIDADGVSRVLHVASGVIAELSGVTITGGNAGAGAGGGILNEGGLTVTGCHITGNRAAFAGGISNALGASLIVQKSTVSNNLATGNSTAGGIASVSDVTITNTTISGNRATGSGGDNGGGLRLGSATIENSTITDNFAVGQNRAGGLRIHVGTVTLRNSIVAANTRSTPDISSQTGSLSSGGYNLVGNPGSLTINGNHDQKGTPAAPLDPLLFPLTDNRGGTPTHALRLGSPALDAGDRFGAIADQRGLARPFDAAGIDGPSDQADIGAVEMRPVVVTKATDSGAGSLRQVIADAPDDSDVLFDPAVFGVPRTVTADGGEIVIATRLTILGPGADRLTVSGGNATRILRILSGVDVALSDLRLADGSVGSGGAIASSSNLAVTRCAIANNRAANVGGGLAIDSGAVGRFAASTLSGNRSGLRGGAVHLLGATATFANCTISGNRSGTLGGAVALFNSGRPDLAIELTDSTIVDNSGTDAAGVRLQAGAGAIASAALRNSIVANDGTNLRAVAGAGGSATFVSRGFNLSDDEAGGFLDADTDQFGADPKLGPLQYNGGPTQTHMPLPGSPALDQGNGVGRDQRGWTRAFDLAGTPAVPGGDGSDIGAVEAHPAIVTNDSNTGAGSLREVVTNAVPDTDVWFDPVFFATERIIFLTSEILIGESLTIHGPPVPAIVSGSGSVRVFNIASDVSVAISDLDMRDGASQPSGGVIASGGDLTLTRCAIQKGETDAQGGGVFLQGAVGRFTDSLINLNHAASRGGGIGLDGASAILTNCTVSKNTAPIFGGGVSLFTSAGDQTLAVTNSTFGNNTAADGGAIRVEAFPNLSATATLRNTILAGVSPTLGTLPGANATATIASLGYNLSTDAADGLLDEETDQTETDPLLGPLQDNGGTTFTYAPLPGSPAIDQGDSSGTSTDQRGAPRPLDDPARQNAAGGDGADIGAVEAPLPPPPTATATPTVTVTRTASATATVTRTRTATPPIGAATATATSTRTATAPIATATATRTGTQPTAVNTATATRTASATQTRTGTQPTRTATPTGSPTMATPTDSPSPTPTTTLLPGACVGDCDGNRQVTISELILAVNIALGSRPTADCLAADSSGDGTVTINEIITAVGNALGSCPG